jgi:predicted Zn finger-like uncharacterized protein
MILTCPKCKAQYTLDPDVLGASGREVRCVGCSHTWFQQPEAAAFQQPEAEAFTPAPPEEKKSPADSTPASIVDALNSILDADEAALEAALSAEAGAKTAAPPKQAAEAPAPPKEKKTQVIRQEASLPIIHNPLGMGATAFGVAVFCFFTFLTLGALFAAKEPILRHWPQMSLLYRTMGFEIQAPGEGLQLSEVTAERRIDSDGRMLVIEGRMTNMAQHDIPYPALHVALKDGEGRVVKEWDLKTGGTQIASGDVVPLMVQLDNAPQEGASLEVRVKEK